MELDKIKNSLMHSLAGGVDFYERRPGKFQLMLPLRHEDGDMVDIYLQASPKGEGYVRICDFGMTLMRLSYNYELNSETRERIFSSILIDNGVSNDGGKLYLDARMDFLYEGIMQFAGCAQKVCNMRYWSRELVRSTFYEDLGKYITGNLGNFRPMPNQRPLTGQVIQVDWSLTRNERSFYVFGIRGDKKATEVAYSLLEFQKAQLLFISLVVHENMEDLGRKEVSYLTRNADTQYPLLKDFEERGGADMNRLAA